MIETPASSARDEKLKASTLLERLEPGLWLALILVICLRIGLGLVGFLSLNAQQQVTQEGDLAWHQLLSIWQRWDANWYRQIAESGYSAGRTTAFYPLYPALTRLVSAALSEHILLAQLLVSSIGFTVASWLLYKLTHLEAGKSAAFLAVLLTACYPTGFFLLAPYTEGLFLALTVAAFWFARSNRPWLAGLAGLLAALTRAQGALLALPLIVEGMRWRRAGRGGSEFSLLAAGLPALGWLAVAAYHRLVVGEHRSPLEIQRSWGYQLVPPWDALSASWTYLAGGARRGLPEVEALNLICLVGFAMLGLLVIRRLPLSYALYVWPSLALLLTRQMWFSPLMSMSRLTLVLFPCIMVLAMLLTRWPRLAVGWLVVSALLQAWFMRLFARGAFVA